jgi:hypothetical protein
MENHHHIIKNTNNLASYLGVCINTLRNNYLHPLLELERTKGIKTGIIKGGTSKRPQYIFLLNQFLEAVQLLNKKDSELNVGINLYGNNTNKDLKEVNNICQSTISKELNCEGKPTISIKSLKASDTEQQLERLLSVRR